MTIEQIRQRAIIKCDRSSTYETSGKWSEQWWTDLVNEAQGVLADLTGYNQGRHLIPVTANTQISAFPTTLNYGLLSLYIGDQLVQKRTAMQMDEDYPGWYYQSEWPNQPQNDDLEVLSSSTADTTQTITAYGTDYTGRAYATGSVALSGTTFATLAITGGVLKWDEVQYFSLDAACAGTVTIREASANATVTTITAGETTAGTAISTDMPQFYVVRGNKLCWYPIPDANYTAIAWGGVMPGDFVVTTDDATPDGLPTQFHWILAEGAAALAKGVDLHDQESANSEDASAKSFFNGVQRLRQWVDILALSDNTMIELDQGLGFELYDVR